MLVGWFCALACSAALAVHGETITLFGQPVGRYVDDTTPGQCQVVSQLAGQGDLVVAGVAPSGGGACPGAVDAREWYPFDCRYPPGAWGPVPEASAYILQARFAWPGCRPPSPGQRARLFRAAERWHPALILWY